MATTPPADNRSISQQTHNSQLKTMKNSHAYIRELCYNLMHLTIGLIIVAITILYLHEIGKFDIDRLYVSDYDIQYSHMLDTVHNIQQYHNQTHQQTYIRLSLRPQTKLHNNTKTYKHKHRHRPSAQAYFAYSLYTNPQQQQYIDTEHWYYNNKYNIDQYPTQQHTQQHTQIQNSICVVSVGRNLVYKDKYKKYIISISRQVYDRYHVVYVDDCSDDNTTSMLQQYISQQQYISIYNKLTIVHNSIRMYALYSRYIAITQYCNHNDIIVQLDADDQFIGRYVFATINAIYSADTSIWVMYSSYIYWDADYGQPSQGMSIPVPDIVLKKGSYRDTTQWYTSATRTFRRQLIFKINTTDFIDQQGNYYKWTSDLFMHYSLVQLAGYEHYKFVHEVFYYYNRQHNTYCAIPKAISRLNALKITPYLPLQSLQSESKRDPSPRDIKWIQIQKSKLKQQWDKQKTDQYC